MTEIDLATGPRGHLARGLGRSYGDAAANAGGTLWQLEEFDNIDFMGDRVRVGAGVVLADLLDVIIPRGFFFPATPGTKFVTIGGAIAADVHGKNHHRDGSLGDHVTHLRLIDGLDRIREVVRGEELFEATIGGMGLTGIILDATITLRQIVHPAVIVDTVRTKNLDETLAEIKTSDTRHRYSVAWIDVLAGGRSRGRAVITSGDHPDRVPDAADWKGSSTLVSVPDLVPSRLLNPLTMRFFNEAWYRRAPRHRVGELQSTNRFFYPLDAIGNWNRAYGPRGFLQYQVALPDAGEEDLRRLVEMLGSGGAGSFLVVLKRFGPGRGLLSFPIPGWTLAVDVPAAVSGLEDLLDRADELVVEAGGRTYFAKDARTAPSHIPKMYPEIDRWRHIASEADPHRRFTSDLDRRLGLRQGT